MTLKSKKMNIRNDENVAKVIDGQHKIKGLQDYSGQTFQLNVTIFVDMDIEDQAMVFATINIAQTKVTRSLVYDLYEFTQKPSPQKTSHNVAKLLNSRSGSPFKDRIKILGKATKQNQTLTQAIIVESLIKLISGSVQKAEEDRELCKRNQRPARTSDINNNSLIFRDLWIDGEDAKIAKIMWNYFSAVKLVGLMHGRELVYLGISYQGQMVSARLMRFLPF